MSLAPLHPTEVGTARLQWTPATLIGWYPEEVLRRRLAAAARDVALIGDRDFAARFRRQIHLRVDADEPLGQPGAAAGGRRVGAHQVGGYVWVTPLGLPGMAPAPELRVLQSGPG